MSQSIQPLRIQKNTPLSSPKKMNGLHSQRPLVELGPMERRRNSPSFNQNTRKNVFHGDSSPFDSSPNASDSPRLYWQNRDSTSPTRFNSENRNPLSGRESSPSPAKRRSIENLKRASRVRNSNMFTREQKQEYDPTSSPRIERPLATGRPLSVQVQGNAYGGMGIKGLRPESVEGKKTLIDSSLRSPIKSQDLSQLASSPSKGQSSPTKSSMSKKSRYNRSYQGFDPENGIWSDEEESSAERELPPGKSLHRHAKSVTFDAAPPVINEYEMTTPDPSSVASGSRDGSFDSGNDEEEQSFDRGSSNDPDDSFDASLEDTEKTPVVLPEDWRFMSPTVANDDLAAHVEDPFEEEHSNPAHGAQPSNMELRPSPTRTDSVNSNGERRPLPPLPALGMPMFPRARSDSANSLSATAERASSAQRQTHSPPRPASITKAEIQGMGGCSMPIEERLRLMMLQEEAKPPVTAEKAPEHKEGTIHHGSPIETSSLEINSRGIQIHEGEVEEVEEPDLGEYKLPPRISRESILRKVKSRTFQEPELDDSMALSPNSGFEGFSTLDPDTPIPSLETETIVEKEVVIKQEPDEDGNEIDIYSIPDLYSQHLQAESYLNAVQKLEEFKAKSAASQLDDDDESHYSIDSKEDYRKELISDGANDNDGPPTPKAEATNEETKLLARANSHRMSLPQFAALLGESDFGFGMNSFMANSQPVDQEPTKSVGLTEPSWDASLPKFQESMQQLVPSEDLSHREYFERPMTPETQLQPPRFPGQQDGSGDEPQTPESVIRHSFAESPVPDSPGIPEPQATIKAPGAKLKTRPSITPADVQAMAEVRRQVSSGSDVPAVPKIPERHLSRPSVVAESDESLPDSAKDVSFADNGNERDLIKVSKRKSSLLPLEVPVEGGDSLGFGIESEFDRVIEAQKVVSNFSYSLKTAQVTSSVQAEYMVAQDFKPYTEWNANKAFRTQKGYLMRQNTKVIVASSASHESADASTDTKENQDPAVRGTRSAGNSPRKPSQTPTWTTEPWNGKVRRKSIRKSGGSPSKAPSSGPAPPLPGQQSNVSSSLNSVNEEESMQATDEIGEDGERGRLFVKVIRVKDLDLPLPKGERSYFALTLDNGLHCVTTSWLELGKTAPIGQEFELVVLNDLEFQLTLQTKLEEPKAKPIIESPTKAAKPTKPSTFSRVFASPRKRKEMEMKQQEEAKIERQKQQAAQNTRRPTQPTAWDLLHNLVAKDGSFARSYVCLNDHEKSAYGKPYIVDVPCFNEWAAEDAHNMSSVRSKRSAMNGGTNKNGTQYRAPYRVGKLELQLLFVPKPKGARDEDMPKSMNACIRELKEAESAMPVKWEGHLSQQGGDCPYWRRRFFTLNGSKFTAYHEATRQPRATINLAKASKLIDDKNSLIHNDVSPKKGGRRKSAFAEEEEGYMFVEEGFRMRFANGETIDFYADSAAEKDGWMKALSEVVGKDTTNKPKTWTDLVLAKQRAAPSKAAPPSAQQGQSKTTSSAKQAPMRSAPPTPAKNFAHTSAPPPVPHMHPRRSEVAERRYLAKPKSMVF